MTDQVAPGQPSAGEVCCGLRREGLRPLCLRPRPPGRGNSTRPAPVAGETQEPPRAPSGLTRLNPKRDTARQDDGRDPLSKRKEPMSPVQAEPAPPATGGAREPSGGSKRSFTGGSSPAPAPPARTLGEAQKGRRGPQRAAWTAHERSARAPRADRERRGQRKQKAASRGDPSPPRQARGRRTHWHACRPGR